MPSKVAREVIVSVDPESSVDVAFPDLAASANRRTSDASCQTLRC